MDLVLEEDTADPDAVAMKASNPAALTFFIIASALALTLYAPTCTL